MANNKKPNTTISGSGFSFDNINNGVPGNSDFVVVGPGVSFVGNGGNSATEQGIPYDIEGYGGSGSTSITSHNKIYKYYWFDMEYTKTWDTTKNYIIVNDYIDVPNWLFNLGECTYQGVDTDPDLESTPGISFYWYTRKMVGKQVYVNYQIQSSLIHSITFKLRVKLRYLAGYAGVFKQEGSDIMISAACISNTSADANLKSRYRINGQEIFAPTRYGASNNSGSNSWREWYTYSNYGGVSQSTSSDRKITRQGTFPHFVLRGRRYGPGKELKVYRDSSNLKITYGDEATLQQSGNYFIDGVVPTKIIFLLQGGGAGGGVGCWGDDPYTGQAMTYDGGGGGAGGSMFCVIDFEKLYSSYRTRTVYVTIGAGGKGGTWSGGGSEVYGKNGGSTTIECENQQGDRVTLAYAGGGVGPWDTPGPGGGADDPDVCAYKIASRVGGNGGSGSMGAWGSGTKGDSQSAWTVSCTNNSTEADLYAAIRKYSTSAHNGGASGEGMTGGGGASCFGDGGRGGNTGEVGSAGGTGAGGGGGRWVVVGYKDGGKGGDGFVEIYA